MAGIPPSVFFEITSPLEDPITPPPSANKNMVSAATHTEPVYVSEPAAATALSPSSVSHSLSRPFQPPVPSSTPPIRRYPSYFNNFSSTCNAHPSLPFNIPSYSTHDNPFAFPSQHFANSQHEPGSSSHMPQFSVMQYPSFTSLIHSMRPTQPLSSLALNLVAPNITNPITVRPFTPEDDLTCQTQYTTVLISHGLLGLVDGSVTPPSMSLMSSTGEVSYNLEF